MYSFAEMLRSPRRMGVGCAIGAVLLGLIYLIVAGAPTAYLAVNAGACVLGLMILAFLDRLVPQINRPSGVATLLMALALLVTALFGVRIEGVARWIALGPLVLQPSLILLPMMIIGFARSRNIVATVGLLVAALALAIQPDRAMSAMLVAGLAALIFFRSDRATVTALIGSVCSFAVTFAQADTLPAMPFVEQIFYSSFDVSLIAGLVVLGGAVLLVVPAIAGWVFDAGNRHIYAVFGAIWFVAIAAAAAGNYPTPVVGYSGGAILGYLLSISLLPVTAHSGLVQEGEAS